MVIGWVSIFVHLDGEPTGFFLGTDTVSDARLLYHAAPAGVACFHLDALDALYDARLTPFLTALRRWNRTGDAQAARDVLNLWDTMLARELLLAPTPT